MIKYITRSFLDIFKCIFDAIYYHFKFNLIYSHLSVNVSIPFVLLCGSFFLGHPFPKGVVIPCWYYHTYRVSSSSVCRTSSSRPGIVLTTECIRYRMHVNQVTSKVHTYNSNPHRASYFVIIYHPVTKYAIHKFIADPISSEVQCTVQWASLENNFTGHR